MSSEDSLLSDEAMLAEIKEYLRTSSSSDNKQRTRKRATGKSPYFVDMTRDLPDGDHMASVKNPFDKRRKRKAQGRRKLPRDPDDLLYHYASMDKYKHNFTKEEIEVKAVALPFQDSMLKIEESMNLENSLQSSLPRPVANSPIQLTTDKTDMKRSNQNVSKSDSWMNSGNVTVGSPVLNRRNRNSNKSNEKSRFHRKYPRLCSGFQFSDEELQGIELRSDFWMIRFMEECYDEAFHVCHVPVSNETRWRMRNGFDLGSMEAFPLVVQRLLGARYSVMEVRRRICMQFLCTLQHHMDVCELSRYKEVPGYTDVVDSEGKSDNNLHASNLMFDGGRAHLFAKFLSEEYELDFLALFLQKRYVLQSSFNFCLKDVTQSRIWIDETAVPMQSNKERVVASNTVMRDDIKLKRKALSGEMRYPGKVSSHSGRLNPKHATSIPPKASESAIINVLNSYSDDECEVAGANMKRSSSAGFSNSLTPMKDSVTSNSNSFARKKRPLTIADDFDSSIAISSDPSSRTANVKRRKMVPVRLPNHWHFVRDVALPDAPLVAMESGLLSLVCMILLPQCPTALRTYLSDRIIDHCKVSIIESPEQRATNTEVSLSETGRVSLASTYRAIAERKVLVIPLYVLLQVLCFEWKKLSSEAKASLEDTNTSSQSLKELNEVYNNDCQLMKDLERDILATKTDLGAVQARYLSNDKKLRRLERKRKSHIITNSEIVDLEDARTEATEVQLNMMAVESKLKTLFGRKKAIQRNVERLWSTATYGSGFDNSDSKPVTKLQQQKLKPASDWKMAVASLFMKVIGVNRSDEVEQQKTRHEKTLRKRIEEEKGVVEEPLSEEKQDPSHRFFIIEVLAKLLVHNSIREGVRRVSLQEFLRHQESELLLQYGSMEYKQQAYDRLRMEHEEIDRRLWMAASAKEAQKISPAIVDLVIEKACDKAGLALFDSWSLLDDDPAKWLTTSQFDQVEFRFHKAKAAFEAWRKKQIFFNISKNYRVKIFIKMRHNKSSTLVWKAWMKFIARQRFKQHSAVLIQRCIRAFLSRALVRRHMGIIESADAIAARHYASVMQSKSWKMIQFWSKSSSLKRRYRETILALKDRRFIITFYTWRDQFHKHKYSRIINTAEKLRCVVLIQCSIRCAISRRRATLLRAQRRIALGIKCYLAWNRVNQERIISRRLADYADGACCVQQHFSLKMCFVVWKQKNLMTLGLIKVTRAVRNDKMRRRFAKWRKYSNYRTRILSKKAIRLQKMIRMWLVHRRFWYYYRWRRGFVSGQNLYRRHLCMLQYAYDIYYYRAAKLIQKITRGYLRRLHIGDARIADIHYAASHNNYDRLKFYVDRFPELITEIDSHGNSALHAASSTAARRTIKLLMRSQLDPDLRNSDGYTAMHLLIMSPAATRDECFLYMIERGFDDNIRAPQNKTCLILACEHGRAVIARHLLEEEDHDPNIADDTGQTCLQAACAHGILGMVKDLIDNEADVNAPGANGTYPLHDVTHSGSVDIANLLFSHGAYINVYEPYQYQTPLMWAAWAGSGPLCHLYAFHGAEINARDYNGQSAAHYGALSGNGEVYNALREADCDFDALDSSGNSPLHVAAEHGNVGYAIEILKGGCYPSWQNDEGDQPAHIAARYNQLELLKVICQYDEHIARLNYAHHTPLGVAKFYGSSDCQKFLEQHYRMVEVLDGRNKVGEIWWDKPIEDAIGEWDVQVTATAERFYINHATGEVRTSPPVMEASNVATAAERAELPLRRKVVKVTEENKITKHAYYLSYAQQQEEIKDMSRDYVNATIITKYARRKLARMELARLIEDKARRGVLARFVKRTLPKFMVWRRNVWQHSAIRIQAAWIGYHMRRDFYWYPGGEYYQRREYLARWRLRYKLWAMWKFYKKREEFQQMRISKSLPQNLSEWQEIIDLARRPQRIVGVFEEYLYPGTRNVYFYRHSLTGNCVFEKPKKLQVIDDQQIKDEAEIKKYGASLRQVNLTIKLQALWRGYKIRSYTEYVARALEISLHAEQNYMNSPEIDSHLYNYALHCFVNLQDMSRARRVFVECLRRMQWRGPDIPFVLYSYSIFALVAHDEDYNDVQILLGRARQAEEELDTIKRSKLGQPQSPAIAAGTFRHGKIFELASVGFFRHSALTSRTSLAWQNFAVCRFLIFNDFNGSFDAFMNAFHYAPEDKKLMECFNIMMTHFHGKDKAKQDAVVKERMRFHAQEDADREEQRRQVRVRAKLRADSAKRIQTWYHNRKAQRIYDRFMDAVRENIRRKTAAAAGSRMGTPNKNARRANIL